MPCFRAQGRRNGQRPELASLFGRARHGFTLIEVMLAIALSAMALTAATMLLLGLSDRARQIDALTEREDREGNAELLLRTTVRNLDLPRDTTRALEGTPEEVRFRSWCDGEFGWPVPCAVRLHVRETSGGKALVLELGPDQPDGAPEAIAAGGTVIQLWAGLGAAGLLYLVDPGSGGRWTDRWSDRTLPRALGVVGDADTLILPIR